MKEEKSFSHSMNRSSLASCLLTMVCCLVLLLLVPPAAAAESQAELFCNSNTWTLYRCNWNGASYDCDPAVTQRSATHVRNWTFADFDDDGNEDIALAVFLPTTFHEVCYGNGVGGFDDCRTFPKAFTNKTMDVDSGDLDSDGDLDLVFGGYGDDRGEACLNNGDSFDCVPINPFREKSNLEAVVASDFDGDGDADVALSQRGEPTYCINDDGTGRDWTCQRTPGMPGMPGSNWGGGDRGDADGDGVEDILYTGTRWGPTYTNVCLNRFASGGDFDCRPVGSASWNNPRGEFGDLDGDGDLDLALAIFREHGSPSRVCLNDGDGDFSCGTTLATGPRNNDVGVGDYDGDGDLDLFFVDARGASHQCTNDGTASFTCRVEPTPCTKGMSASFHGGGNANQTPVAVCRDATVTADAACAASVVVADIDDGSYDPDGAHDINSLCITDVDGSPVDCAGWVDLTGVDSYSLGLTITDLAAESDSCDAAVHLIDEAAPDITCPMDVTVLWTADTDPPATGSATATDNCSYPTVAHSDVTVPGDCLSETITRTWTATDGSSNSGSCHQVVEVQGPCAATGDLTEFIYTLPPDHFAKGNRQAALLNKLDEVLADLTEPFVLCEVCAALGKLEHDILPKLDGEPSPPDWITNPDSQQAAEDTVRAIINALNDLADSLGGCGGC